MIDLGIDNEEVASQVATAKATLPKCYYYLGGAAIKSQNYDEALKNFSKSAELAELYGDMTQMSKSNGWVAKIYQIQGGDAFNNKDYKTAAGIFEKGYKADPTIGHGAEPGDELLRDGRVREGYGDLRGHCRQDPPEIRRGRSQGQGDDGPLHEQQGGRDAGCR